MAEFAIQDTLIAQLRIDTSMVKKDVEKGLPEVEKGLDGVKSRTEAVEGAYVKAGKEQDRFVRTGFSGIRRLRDRINLAQFAVAGLVGAMAGAIVAVDKLGQAANTREGLINLGVDEERISRISQALGGTVDKLTLARKLLDARNEGAGVEQFESMAKSSAVVAKELAISKAQALELVSQGSLTDGQLQRLGTSAIAIQNKITSLELRRGGALSEAERRYERINAIIEAARQKSGNFTAKTQQAGDQAAKLYARFKDAGHELGQTLLPHVTKFAKWLTTSVKWLDELIKKARKPDPTIKKQIDDFNGWYKARTRSEKDWKKFLQAREAKQKSIGGASAKILDIDKAILASSKELDQVLARQAASKQRAREEARRQRLEEARARQEAAKDLVRNSSEKLIQTIADQGGAFGTIASAMTDVFEKTRMFSATGWGLDGIRAFTKIAQENRNNANADLIKQIELNKERLKIDGKALEVAKLLAGWAQGGADDTKEFVANEKAANAQLRTGLSLLQSRAKVGQLVLERANLQKDVTQFQEKTEKSINILMARRDALAKKGTKEALAQAAQHVIAIQRLERTNKTFQKIATERRQILAIAERHAQIELSIEKQQKRNANRRAVEDMQAQVAAARRQLASLRGRGDGAGFLADQKAKAQETKRAIEDLSLRASQLQQQMAAGFANAGDKQVAQDELASIKERIRLHKDLLDANKRVTDEKLRGLTVTGAFINQMRTQAKDFTKQVGVQLAGTFQGFMGSVGNGVAGMFQTIASGGELTAQEMGKNFLNILGDIAMQMGGFFVTAGTAQMFVPPYTGAGAIAGGLALMGLGGALKGGAAAITTPQTAAPSAPTFALGGNQPNLLPADTSRTDQRPVELHYHVGRTPWSRTTPTPEQDYADMMAWSGQMSRRTGLVDPFAPAAAMGGLRG